MHKPNTRGVGGHDDGDVSLHQKASKTIPDHFPLGGHPWPNTWRQVQLLSRSLSCENLQSLMTAKLLGSQKAKSNRDPLPLAAEEKKPHVLTFGAEGGSRRGVLIP